MVCTCVQVGGIFKFGIGIWVFTLTSVQYLVCTEYSSTLHLSIDSQLIPIGICQLFGFIPRYRFPIETNRYIPNTIWPYNLVSIPNSGQVLLNRHLSLAAIPGHQPNQSLCMPRPDCLNHNWM